MTFKESHFLTKIFSLFLLIPTIYGFLYFIQIAVVYPWFLIPSAILAWLISMPDPWRGSALLNNFEAGISCLFVF